MSTREIRRLRRKFIAVSMLSIFLAMMFIGSTVNAATFFSSRHIVNETLNSLIKDTQKLEDDKAKEDEDEEKFSLGDFLRLHFDNYPYCVVCFDGDGNVLSSYTNIDERDDKSKMGRSEEAHGVGLETMKESAVQLLNVQSEKGQKGSCYYKRSALTNGNVVVAQLDSTQLIESMSLLSRLTAGLGFLGLIIAYFFVRKFSARAIQPEIENSARQKRFITNASHELKTPLAVIRANTEMLELTAGENEWTASTLKQVDHLNGLIQNLVMITRSQEQEDRRELTDIDAAKAVNESFDAFELLAQQRGLRIHRDVREGLRFRIDESKLRQLTSILADNAIKYCDENGTVTVALHPPKNGKGLLLSVSNDYAAGANVDCSRFFDRFYREDASHNIDKGGYGIGLSIAESICRQYKGTISADWKNGVIRFVCSLK